MLCDTVRSTVFRQMGQSLRRIRAKRTNSTRISVRDYQYHTCAGCAHGNPAANGRKRSGSKLAASRDNHAKRALSVQRSALPRCFAPLPSPLQQRLGMACSRRSEAQQPQQRRKGVASAQGSAMPSQGRLPNSNPKIALTEVPTEVLVLTMVLTVPLIVVLAMVLTAVLTAALTVPHSCP